MSQPGKKFTDYESFVEKFKIPKTSDDCYTPEDAYRTILEWVMERYELPENCRIVRPFWPGADYLSYEYGPDDVVVDNPPFSILSKIVRDYERMGVRFFLFAQGTTVLHNTRMRNGLTQVFVGHSLIYENGAQVSTAFVTNMSPDIKIELAKDLGDRIKKLNPGRRMTIVDFPPGYTNGARLGTLSKHTSARITEAEWADYLPNGRKIFGGGAYIDPEQLATIQREAEEKKQKENSALLNHGKGGRKDMTHTPVASGSSE